MSFLRGIYVTRKESKVGRPPGRKKTSKIEILLEPELKDNFMMYLHEENKCASVQIREWIVKYITNNEKNA
jgi:hypothetical protein